RTSAFEAAMLVPFLKHSLLIALPLLILPNLAHAVTLVPLVGPPLSHTGNLIQNGSFEDHPGPPANLLYWATGTTNTPFATPANWDTSGASQSYALWGDVSGVLNTLPATDGL